MPQPIEEVFELAWQQRVVFEKRELDEKLDKLSAFLSDKLVLQLDKEDQDLLIKQHGAMLNYSVVLGQRIARFN